MSKRSASGGKAPAAGRSSAARREGAWLRRLEQGLRGLPELARMETLTVGDIWGERLHTTASHELIHVLQGRARIQFEQRAFSVAPGDTFLVPQETAHRDVRVSENAYRVIYLFFHWPAGEAIVRGIDSKTLLKAPVRVKHHLHLLMKELEDEYLGAARGARERLRLLLLEVLLALLRHAHRAQPSVREPRKVLARARRGRLALEVRRYLLEHCGEAISLDALAERQDVSPFHLCRSFSQEFGISITDMLATIRMERAKELLKERKLSIKEVAAQVGYTNGNYFAKVFRRLCGHSPSEYQTLARPPRRRSAGASP